MQQLCDVQNGPNKRIAYIDTHVKNACKLRGFLAAEASEVNPSFKQIKPGRPRSNN